MKLYAVKREKGGVVEWLNVAEDDWEDMPIAIGAEGYVRLAVQTCGGTVVEFVPASELDALRAEVERLKGCVEEQNDVLNELRNAGLDVPDIANPLEAK